MDENLVQLKDGLNNCRSEVLALIDEINSDSIEVQLQAIARIDELQDFSCNDEAKELKDYKALKEVMKKLYVATARTLMNILNAESGFSGDAGNSFNYTEPVEQIRAAEYIKKLPNAFIGGPMKSALNSPVEKIRQIAVDYFDTLPREIQFSDIFPPGFNRIVTKLKAQMNR